MTEQNFRRVIAVKLWSVMQLMLPTVSTVSMVSLFGDLQAKKTH